MTAFRTARFHDGDSYKCVIARLGRTRMHLTFITDNGVEHRSVPKTESTYLQPLPHKGGEYPLQLLIKRFAAVGRARGITEAAKAELSAARS